MLDNKVSPQNPPLLETPRSNTNFANLRIILISVLLAGTGQLIFKAAVQELGELELSVDMFFSMVTSPLLLFGLAVFGCSAFLWLIALMRAELSFAYPFISLSYVIVLLGGTFLFKEEITLLRLLGFLVIIVGLIVVARDD